MLARVSLVTILVAASFMDLRSGKIPNWLTLPAILLGVALSLLTGGRDGLFNSVTGLAVGSGLLLLPFVLGGMGGGDVKLLGAIGAFEGPVMTIRIFFLSAVIGLAVSLLVIFTVKRYRVAYLSRLVRLIGRESPGTGEDSNGPYPRVYLPYGVVLASGTLFSYYIFQ
jgi:prepilin peptidase CpaA